MICGYLFVGSAQKVNRAVLTRDSVRDTMAYLRDALFLCFMSLCWAQATNLCEVACVQDLFKENCGGVTCVFDTPTQEAVRLYHSSHIF